MPAHVDPNIGAIWLNGNTPKLEWNRYVVMSTKTCNISETEEDRTAGMTD